VPFQLILPNPALRDEGKIIVGMSSASWNPALERNPRKRDIPPFLLWRDWQMMVGRALVDHEPVCFPLLLKPCLQAADEIEKAWHRHRFIELEVDSRIFDVDNIAEFAVA